MTDDVFTAIKRFLTPNSAIDFGVFLSPKKRIGEKAAASKSGGRLPSVCPSSFSLIDRELRSVPLTAASNVRSCGGLLHHRSFIRARGSTQEVVQTIMQHSHIALTMDT